MGDRNAQSAPDSLAETSEARVLADLPPDNWSEARRRHALLVEYLRIPQPTIDDADRCARRLNVSTRQLQRLVRTYRFYRAGRSTGGSRRGQRSVITPPVAQMIDDVVRDLGSSATDAEVQAEVERRSLRANLPVASLTAVRTRRGRHPTSVNLSERLGVDFDVIVDCCALTFDVIAGDDAKPAVFCAVLASNGGDLMAWSLFAGFPDPDDLMSVIWSSAQRARTSVAERPLIMAAPIHENNALFEHEDELRALGFELTRQTSIRMRRGAAIVPSLGLRIGRIPFSPLRKPDASPSAAVPLALAREVITQTLGRAATSATQAQREPARPSLEASPARPPRPAATGDGVPAGMHDAIADIVERHAHVDAGLASQTADAVCQTFGPLLHAAIEAARLLQTASANLGLSADRVDRAGARPPLVETEAAPARVAAEASGPTGLRSPEEDLQCLGQTS